MAKIAFKHHDPVTICSRYGHLFLEQDGRLFTNAEFNRALNLWEPTPRPVDEKAVAKRAYGPEREKLQKELQKITSRLREIEKIIGEGVSHGEQNKG